MYAPLTALDRCDRCGAQAYAVTAHAKSTLMWCAHHYREHEKMLGQDVIYYQTDDKEPAPA